MWSVWELVSPQLGQHRVLSKLLIFIYLIQKKWKWLHADLYVSLSLTDECFHILQPHMKQKWKRKSSNFFLPWLSPWWAVGTASWEVTPGRCKEAQRSACQGLCFWKRSTPSAPGSPPPPRWAVSIIFSHLCTPTGHPKSPAPFLRKPFPSSCHLTFPWPRASGRLCEGNIQPSCLVP